MKKLVLSTVLLAGTLVADADDYAYPYLVFQTAGGTEQSVAVDNLRITFGNGQMAVNSNDGTILLALADLGKMYFSQTAAGSGGTTGVEALPTDGGQVEVYSTGGMFLGRFDSVAKAQQQLKRGVYVMKTTGKTFKTVVK